MKLVLRIALLLFFAFPLHAQDMLRTRFGLFGGASVNLHNADFRALPGVPNCCPRFTSGTGTGPLAGLLFEMPIAESILFGIQASYISHTAHFLAEEVTTVIVNGSGQSGILRHTVDAQPATIGLEPYISYRLFGNFFVNGGLRAGFVVVKSYSQSEQISQPEASATFLDSNGNDSHSRIRNSNSGNLPLAASLLLHAIAGISLELPLNTQRSLLLVPKASFAFSLNNMVDGIAWKANGLQASIAIKYSPQPEVELPKVYDTIYRRDTVTKLNASLAAMRLTLQSKDKTKDVTRTNVSLEQTTITEHYLLELPDAHDISCTVSAVGLDDDGNEEAIAKLRVEEFLSTNAYPLLGFVFFEKGKSEIPERYNSYFEGTKNQFKPESLSGSGALGIHHNVLNIIAGRMKKYPKAKLMLTGCNSDEDVEQNNTGLSEARVKTVKDYFVNTWGIAASRIEIKSQNLPDKPSNPRTPLGQEENRRVEITSDVSDVIDIFIASDTTRTSNPPQLRFKITANSSVGVGEWSLNVMQGNSTLKQFHGNGIVPVNLDWDLANDQRGMPKFNQPLKYFLEVKNSKGDIAKAEGILATEITSINDKKKRKQGDVVIDKYNLVLFDFAKSDITAAHVRIITLVKSNLKTSSQISIDGYTDITGSAASNKKLATSRATSTSEALGRKDAVIHGIGASRLLYPNDTPEGRFYCRTVQVVVRTPVE